MHFYLVLSNKKRKENRLNQIFGRHSDLSNACGFTILEYGSDSDVFVFGSYGMGLLWMRFIDMPNAKG